MLLYHPLKASENLILEKEQTISISEIPSTKIKKALSKEQTEDLAIRKSPTNQGIFLYGSDHACYRRELIKNIHALFLDILRKADNAESEQKEFYIFVEHVPLRLSCYMKGSSPKMLGKIRQDIFCGLLPEHQERPFRRSVVINCDIRKKNSAATEILRVPLKDPGTGDESIPATYKEHRALLESLEDESTIPDYRRHMEEHYGCTLADVTFEDLEIEFKQLEQQMLEYKRHWDGHPVIQAEFDRSLKQARHDFAKLANAITEEKIAKRKVIDFAKQLIDEDRVWGINWLSKAIVHAFSNFVDLYVYHHILLLRNDSCSKIVVLVGEAHRQRITTHLDNTEMYDEVPYRLKTLCLEEPDFEILRKPFSELERDLTQLERVRTEWFITRIARISFFYLYCKLLTIGNYLD